MKRIIVDGTAFLMLAAMTWGGKSLDKAETIVLVHADNHPNDYCTTAADGKFSSITITGMDTLYFICVYS